MTIELDFAALKAKARRVRDGHPENLRLRVHRALSWLARAEKEEDDPDARFIFAWIGFNALYAEFEPEPARERARFEEFFGRIAALDDSRRIYDAIWLRFPHEVRLLLENQYVFKPFWNHANGVPGFADWPERLRRDRRGAHEAIRALDTPAILRRLFGRLYVLRNQLVHGGATWNGSVNRRQVADGARILMVLLPLFIDVMMDHPDEDWGRPFYPVVD
ncbi:HEPN domain-containing protein [Oceanicella actignis]|nr:HEPN domain-containing protein [Oceanicella actignis]